MIGDRELLAFRQGYYDLFVSLLWHEPTGELLVGLTEGIGERIRGGRNLHPLFGEGWEEIERVLATGSAEDLGERVADEYTRLFIGPQGPALNPYESYYLTGRLLDRPLIALRSSLREIGIEKQDGYAEPEDFLAFELETMRRLIGRQRAARDSDEEIRWINQQAGFLKQHLLVWAPAAASDLANVGDAPFYRGVGKLLRGFLELERDTFKNWGFEEGEPLQEARERFSGPQEWKGPLFDLSDESS